jgi:hypothetical protein
MRKANDMSFVELRSSHWSALAMPLVALLVAGGCGSSTVKNGSGGSGGSGTGGSGNGGKGSGGNGMGGNGGGMSGMGGSGMGGGGSGQGGGNGGVTDPSCPFRPPSDPSHGSGGLGGKGIFASTYGSGADQRALGVYVPDNYVDDGTWGLTILLHDSVCETWVQQEAYMPVGPQDHMIVVAPQAGTGQPAWWQGTCDTMGNWSDFTYGGESDNFAAGGKMVADLVAKMEGAYNIDRKRTHLAGFSQGGYEIAGMIGEGVLPAGLFEYIILDEGGGQTFLDNPPTTFRLVYVAGGETGITCAGNFAQEGSELINDHFWLALVEGLGHFWPGVMGKPTTACHNKDASTHGLVHWLECNEMLNAK